jgi:peptidoglycan/LPS O-acetylase OafA/YrhL
MKHFRSIDGLRAWLAWIVVLSHVALYTAADVRIPLLEHSIDAMATKSVQIFIIISGFVITHLLLERREPFVPYITRRFLRIYPIYFICLCIGIYATYLHFAVFADKPWGAYVPQPELLAAQLKSLQDHGMMPHLLAHLLLLHGMIPNHILPVSEYMFLGPAWSLSLEWQFYLVAPLILYCTRSQTSAIMLCLVTVAAYVAYLHGIFGQFFDPSFLPGAGLYFATGIGTRLIYSRLPRLPAYPVATVTIVAGFGVLAHDLFSFIFWFAFVAWLRVEQPHDRISVTIDRVFNVAFNSRPARFLGTRSYSTYLIHEPIIHIIVYICVRQFSLQMWPTVIWTLLLTIPATLVAATLLYRYAESNAIDYGKRLFVEVPQSA